MGEVEQFLIHAEKKFRSLSIYHGIAVTLLAKSHFFFSRASEFVDLQRTEEDILKLALYFCDESNDYYTRLKHFIGQKACL